GAHLEGTVVRGRRRRLGRPVTPPDAPRTADPVPWWRRPLWMTRQSWVSIAAAVGFLLSVLLVAFVPVPYVTWAPGETQDVLGTDASGTPLVRVDGVDTYATSGRLDLTTVSVTRVDGHAGLVEVLLAWARPGHDALDRELYYPPGTTEGGAE